MANNQLLAGLINPAYLGGLQQVGQMAGAAPAVSKQRGMLTELYNTAFDPNATQQQFTSAAQQLAAAGKLPEAMEIRTMGQEAISLRKTLESARDRANMDGATAKDKKLYELLKTRSITPEQYSEQLLKEPSVNVTYKEFVDPTDNKEKVFKITTNATTGEEIERVPLGAVAGPAAKNILATKYGSDLFQEARESRDKAAKEANTLEEAADFAANREFYERGTLGSVFGTAKQLAGMGDKTEVFRARLNEIRMSGVLGMLPPGVASDKDVELALTTQVDFNDMDNETASSFLKGMAKIQRAEQEYYDSKIRWISKTGDPNTVGFDFWVKAKDAQRQMDELTSGPAFRQFLGEVQKMQAMPEGLDKQIKEAELYQLFPKEMQAYDNEKEALADWAGVENKPSGFTIKGVN
jgi:hypothetical protein